MKKEVKAIDEMNLMEILKLAIDKGIEAGVNEALRRIEGDKDDRLKNRHDIRLRNTHILLKNYNNFVNSCKYAVYSKNELAKYKSIDVLDECEGLLNEDVYVNSILQSKQRTIIMVNHVKRMIAFYKYCAEQSKEEDKIRKYKVVNGIYIIGKTYDQMADELFCSTKTVDRDRKEALEELSTLIFGIDGIKLNA
jgi:hypothetical protein